MTDKETLNSYRISQAKEKIAEAERMLEENFSPASVINRAYYSIFYSLLGLFISAGISIKTSKHSGVISMFDKEFVKTGKLNKRLSNIVHDVFEARMEGDYKEFSTPTVDEAREVVKLAREFLSEIERHLAGILK